MPFTFKSSMQIICAAHEPGRQAVNRVVTLVRHGTVCTGDPQALAFAALRTRLAPGKAALLLSEVAQAVRQSLRVIDLLAGRESCQVLDAKVDTDCTGDNWKSGDIHLGAERDVVPTVGITLERNRIWALNLRQDLGEFNGTELRQHQHALDPFRTHVLEPQASDHLPGLEPRISGCRAGLHTAEEVGEGSVLVPQALGRHVAGTLPTKNPGAS